MSLIKFNGIWVGWDGSQPSGFDSSTLLVKMTARPDSTLDMSKVSSTPLPDENTKLLNIGGVWEGGAQNNWSAFFTTYNSGNLLANVLKQGHYQGVVLDLETASGEAPHIELNELTGFIEHCTGQGFKCFVTCMSGEAAGYVESLSQSGVDAVIPMLYNGSWSDLYVTNWEAAAKASGAALIAGIAHKYEANYSFLNDTPSPNGIFVWGIGPGGGDATGAQCQALINQYANNQTLTGKQKGCPMI